jgi:hypothetical protein
MTVDLAAGDLLGDAALPAAELSSLVTAAVGHPAAIADWHAEAVPYKSGSPATGALAWVRGITLDGQPWSLFVKVLQHPRHWRLLNQVPDEVREDFLANSPGTRSSARGSRRSQPASRRGFACPRHTADAEACARLLTWPEPNLPLRDARSRLLPQPGRAVVGHCGKTRARPRLPSSGGGRAGL